MSFILDALKKSENDRQDSVPAEFTTVSSGAESPGAPRWLWVLAALLIVNIVVLVSVFMRPDPAAPAVADSRTIDNAPGLPAPAGAPPAAAPDIAARPTSAASFGERVETARRNQPPRPAPAVAADVPAPQQEPAGTTPAPPGPAPGTRPVAAVNAPSDGSQALLLPTFTELRTAGTLQMRDLHMDLHFFIAERARRFVSINAAKYRENDRLPEGPVVREITPDGVVLEYQGRAFLLPRE